MEFKSVAFPKPKKGMSFKGVKKLTKPQRGISLKEILERFTRNEPVEVGHETQDGSDSDIDLEKLRHADLVDKEEYMNKLKAIQGKYEAQEESKKAARDKAAKEKAKEEENARIEKEVQDRLAKEKAQQS